MKWTDEYEEETSQHWYHTPGWVIDKALEGWYLHPTRHALDPFGPFRSAKEAKRFCEKLVTIL